MESNCFVFILFTAALVAALVPTSHAAPSWSEYQGNDGLIVADHWEDMIVGFRPFVFILYDLLVDEETRLSTTTPVIEDIGSLAVIQSIISEGYQAINADGDIDLSPLFMRVMSDNFQAFTELLKDEASEARLERWLSTLQMRDVASFQRIRNVLSHHNITATFEDVSITHSSGNENADDSFLAADFKGVITDCLDSFIDLLHEPSLTHLESLVGPQFVGPTARYLLAEISGDRQDESLILNHFVSSGQCQEADVREKADNLMALINTGLLLEATFVNKNIIELREQERSSRAEMERFYRLTNQRVEDLVRFCS